ncbi:TetR/AcrR family transcriptional regulator [Streptacidiphilus jiangxiensis]|nr:TetR/AcrR family transcriptional regulator [Streptacidiphilus jiangxiensis]
MFVDDIRNTIDLKVHVRPMTGRQARYHAARSAATQAKLLAAMEDLLDAGESFTDITVQRLIEEAGVSRATFYAHFRTKSDVLVCLADRLREQQLARAQAWDPTLGEEDGAERYAQYWLEIITAQRASHSIMAAVRVAASYDPGVGDFYSDDLETFDELIRSLLLSEKAAGSAPADLDAANASKIIIWGVGGAMARHIGTDDGSGDAAFARELGRIFWYGAYRRPAD